MDDADIHIDRYPRVLDRFPSFLLQRTGQVMYFRMLDVTNNAKLGCLEYILVRRHQSAAE